MPGLVVKKKKFTNLPPIESIILTIRGQKVILDADLALIYDIKTKALNQAIKRNIDRFPPDFLFQLTRQEIEDVQNSRMENGPSGTNRSQIVTGSQKHRDPRFSPYAFTEHGAIMAANVLNSPRAVKMSVFVVRAFIKMREQLLSQAEFESRLGQIENILLAHDGQIRDLYEKIRPLLRSPRLPSRRRIGFTAREKPVKYSAKRH